MSNPLAGFYDFVQTRGMLSDKSGRPVVHKVIFYSGLGGVLGQFLSSPFYMIKTHLQSKAVQEIAVGHQHKHETTMSAFRVIYEKYGVKKLGQC